MKWECAMFRDALMRGEEAEPHRESCAPCAEFAARLERFRTDVATRHAGAVPDAGFSHRVRSALPDAESDAFGWAMWRLLPVGFALVLVLAIWSYRTPSPLQMTDADEDLLSWVIETDEASP